MRKVSRRDLWKKVDNTTVSALSEQTVSVPGAEQADLFFKHLAGELLDVRVARRDTAARFDQALAEYPVGPISTSLPDVGVPMLERSRQGSEIHSAAA